MSKFVLIALLGLVLLTACSWLAVHNSHPSLHAPADPSNQVER